MYVYIHCSHISPARARVRSASSASLGYTSFILGIHIWVNISFYIFHCVYICVRKHTFRSRDCVSRTREAKGKKGRPTLYARTDLYRYQPPQCVYSVYRYLFTSTDRYGHSRDQSLPFLVVVAQQGSNHTPKKRVRLIKLKRESSARSGWPNLEG